MVTYLGFLSYSITLCPVQPFCFCIPLSDTNIAISFFFLIGGFGLRILTEAVSVVLLFPVLLLSSPLWPAHLSLSYSISVIGGILAFLLCS